MNCIQNQETIARPRAAAEQGRGVHHHRRAGQRAGGGGPDARLLRRARLPVPAVPVHRALARLDRRGHGEQRALRAASAALHEGARALVGAAWRWPRCCSPGTLGEGGSCRGGRKGHQLDVRAQPARSDAARDDDRGSDTARLTFPVGPRPSGSVPPPARRTATRTPSSTPIVGSAAGSPAPRQVMASRPSTAQRAGTTTVRRCSQAGKMNVGTQAPPSITISRAARLARPRVVRRLAERRDQQAERGRHEGGAAATAGNRRGFPRSERRTRRWRTRRRRAGS